MNLASAKHQNHPDIEKVRKKVFEALEALEGILGSFKTKHVKKLYDIEKINPSYFPGLSVAAAKTIKDLQQGNPSLSLDFILETASKLAGRTRPWESLTAFSEFGKHCGKAMTEDNINYLMTIDCRILEIIGFSIRNKMISPEDESDAYAQEYIAKFKGHPDLVAAFNAIFKVSSSLSASKKSSTNIEWHILNGFIVALGVAAVAIAFTALTAVSFGATAAVAALGCALVDFGLWRTAQPKETTLNALELKLY
jgi:hypothetical protein